MGSSNYITNIAGEVSQHTEYFAFGETFVEEHKDSNNSPYKFNGKELDEESGLYYYWARYYDPRISIWASIDPLAEKYPDQSPYIYCTQNPIRFVDPDGREGIDVIDFIPFVGSGRDIYRGIKNGDMTTLAFGVGGMILDIATAGTGGTLIKGAIKSASKQIAETSLKASMKQIPKLLAENAAKRVILQSNRIAGKLAEEKETKELIAKYGKDASVIVGTQITARFDDGTKVIFDNVVVKDGIIKLINETKAGLADLSTQQKDFSKMVKQLNL